MESCKFHPVTASNFNCPSCHINFCNSCVDQSLPVEPKCFLCGGDVVHHVTADNIEPFWRRLERAFRYPLNSNALGIIVGLSVASTVLSSLPFAGLIILILNLIVAGATVNYAFMCLKSTAEGNMEAPPIAEAFSGTLQILFRLLGMILLIGLGIYAIGSTLGPGLAMVASVVVMIGLPAILMCFGYTDSILESLNPFTFVRLITTVGLPYAVLVIFLMIMITSMGVLQQLIGTNLAALSTLIQIGIGNYYSVVMFHLMGYMLYQYQDKLGVASSADELFEDEAAEPADVALQHANVRLKLGEYDRVDDILKNALDVTPGNKRLWQRYFDFLVRTGRRASLKPFADKYLRHLIETAQNPLLSADYKRIIKLLPTYQPSDPHVRYFVASAVRSAGDSMAAVRLLNGMHKSYPEYENLVTAYYLMKEALNDLPDMEAQVGKCEKLIALLKQNRPGSDEPAPEQQTKAVFNLPDEAVKTEAEKANAAKQEAPAAPKQEEPEEVRSPIDFKL
ncbi:hypothetical protein [Reinekea marinisedimentorum]|uniref:Uncharacterized protein n=1 Tax=Reinekea marinisedimentorum TaxID=230495 RepID=A0A4R3IBR8_9GAMM|nr:hypothetical protein [Reinekea marinisedimentorum]TCS43931.1 hypothetical protein BCF53_101274 [Reinekea marinisedimentorum]